MAAIADAVTKFGYRLPSDVAALSVHYGYGSFFSNNFYLTIHSIFRKHYLDIVEYNHNIYSSCAVRFPSDRMPWATMFELGSYEYEDGEQGDMGCFFLDTAGDVGTWTVGLSRPLQQFHLTLVDFLIQLVQGDVTPQGFPSSFRDAVFIPNHHG